MRKISIYTVISVVCLVIDVAVLWVLVRVGMLAALAGMLSYMLGLVVHYILSVRLVFVPAKSRVVAGKAKLPTQANLQTHPQASAMGHHLAYFFGYFLTGFAGAVLTAGIIDLGGRLAIPLPFSKAVAIGVAFFVVYGLRRYALFRDRE